MLKAKWIPGALLCLTLMLSSCAVQKNVPLTPERFRVLGFTELVVGEPAVLQPQTLNPSAIQLKSVGNTTLDTGGYRYLSTRYQVRNASSAGVASPTPRTNVTLIAGETANTLGKTAIRSITKSNGMAASASLAPLVLPAGTLASGSTLASGQQSFQAFSQPELSALTGISGLVKALPYGFVVDRVGGGRTLDANPAVNDYQGTVTVTVKVPLQTPLSDTPTRFVLAVLITEDSVSQVTESLEEQALGSGDLSTRVAAAGATQVNVFRGSTYSGSGRRGLCQVPVSNAVSPAYLVNSKNQVTLFAPSVSALSPTGSTITATLGLCSDVVPTLSGFSPQNQLVIQAFQSGKRLSNFSATNAGTFSQTGNQWQYLPGNTAGFKPGEEVEVSVVGNTQLTGSVQRFRVGSGLQGAAGFQNRTDVTTGTGPYSIALGDMNGDGDLDLVSANAADHALGVQLGDGAGNFGFKINTPTGTSPFSLALGDFNGDGILDVVNVNQNDDTLNLHLGDGSGSLSTALTLPTGDMPYAVAVGDLNIDGKLDVVEASFLDSTLGIRLGDGSGGLGTRTTVTSGLHPAHLTLGDVNQDGVLDLLSANYSADSVSVLLGNGSGGFATRTDFTVGDSPHALNLGDLNADGRLDLVTANEQDNTFSVLLGTGSGSFLSKTDVATGLYPHSVALGDLDGDGVLDLAISNYNADSTSVLLGNGSGGFAARTDFQVQSNPSQAVVGDVNGDGKLDVVVANVNSNSVSVLLKK